MMPRSLSQTGPEKRRFTAEGHHRLCPAAGSAGRQLWWRHFYQVVLGMAACLAADRYSQPRRAVALLAIGMTLVIATGGIDLSVGAVMAIAGATAASMTVAGHSLPVVLLAALAAGAGRIVERHPRGGP